MAATTMPSISWLIDKITDDYPEICVEIGEKCAWNPDSQTITYSPDDDTSTILHELGHALSGHSVYSLSIELLAMEREAWSRAREVAVSYDITLDENVVEQHLDTYRDWLHSRSLCPSCASTGIEANHNSFECPNCDNRWQVNDARQCQLRRTSTK